MKSMSVLKICGRQRGRQTGGMQISLSALLALLLSMIAGCGNDKDKSSGFDEGFNRLSDAAKVEYVMKNADPDSVARFICNAALGKIPGVEIDTLATATLYAYENYRRDEDLQSFSMAFDEYVRHMRLEDRMRMMKMAGEVDPQRIGYELGLQYVDCIRADRKNVGDVESEIEAFRKACGSDTMMFQRFMTGFKVVLDIDRGKDLSEEIYTKFKNYK